MCEVAILISHLISYWITGYTALHRAASWGHPDCLKVMVLNGADLQIYNTHGERAREIAARYHKDSCVEYLDRAGIYNSFFFIINTAKFASAIYSIFSWTDLNLLTEKFYCCPFEFPCRSTAGSSICHQLHEGHNYWSREAPGAIYKRRQGLFSFMMILFMSEAMCCWYV